MHRILQQEKKVHGHSCRLAPCLTTDTQLEAEIRVIKWEADLGKTDQTQRASEIVGNTQNLGRRKERVGIRTVQEKGPVRITQKPI